MGNYTEEMDREYDYKLFMFNEVFRDPSEREEAIRHFSQIGLPGLKHPKFLAAWAVLKWYERAFPTPDPEDIGNGKAASSGRCAGGDDAVRGALAFVGSESQG